MREMRSEETARLQRWQELGLVPGTDFLMEEKQELEGVMHIRIGERIIVTGNEGVEGVYVERSK